MASAASMQRLSTASYGAIELHNLGKQTTKFPATTTNTSTRAEDDGQSTTTRLAPFLRFFKVRIFARFSYWRSPTERRKVAISQSRRVSALHCLVHALPFGAAVVLLGLNGSDYFISRNFPEIATIQFAAKLHEFLMVCSIVEILSTIVRHHVIESQLPLGALLAPVQASQLSYLWSPEFWSAISSPALRGWRKIAFGLVVFFLVTLMAIVGPSSAIAMIPRQSISSPVYYSLLSWDKPSDSLFPAVIDSSHNITINPNMPNIWDGPYWSARDFNTPLNQGGMKRFLSVKKKPPKEPLNDLEWFYKYINYTIISAAPTLFISRALDEMSMSFTIHNPQIKLGSFVYAFVPTVSVKCIHRAATSGEYYSDPNASLRYWSEDGEYLKDWITTRELLQDILSQNETQNLTRGEIPAYWTDVPELNSTSIIGHFSFYDPVYYEREKPFPFAKILESGRDAYITSDTCTVSAFWSFAKYTWTIDVGNIDEPISIIKLESSIDELLACQEQYPIKLSTRFIRNLGDLGKFSNRFSPGYSLPKIPVIFADALSALTLNSSRGPEGQLYSKPIMRERFTSDNSSTRFQVSLVKHGYGYGNLSTTVRLSLSVLALYCVTVICHVAYLLATGKTLTAWNNATEFLVLALQSRRPQHLGYTSAGVKTMAVLREPISIRVNQDEDLELIFANDRETYIGELKKVVPNQAY